MKTQLKNMAAAGGFGVVIGVLTGAFRAATENPAPSAGMLVFWTLIWGVGLAVVQASASMEAADVERVPALKKINGI